jgi:hypothetical protein
MNGRALISRFCWLTTGLLCVGAIHVAATLNVDVIARPFHRDYVPISSEEARRVAEEECGHSMAGFAYRDCTPTAAAVSWALEKDQLVFIEREVEPIRERIRDVVNIVGGILYALLALGALWAIKSWFAASSWPRVRRLVGLAKPAWTSVDLSGMNETRRLRRAEAEFKTLKSLRDEGLITEAVFVARKDKLKAGIAGA